MIAVNEDERIEKRIIMEKELRIIISGGGTGGHIFPAVSIANAIIELRPDAKILFVGAEGRMEMQRVPDAGYKIIGLPIAGFDRKHLWKNVSVLIKLARSQWKARSIIKNFRPQVAVGVGGYASGPTLKNCRNDGSADSDSGTELVCRSHQQVAGTKSKDYLCRL